MKSMTGFGVGEQRLGEGKVVVEVRALNHRYVEVRTGLAPELSCHAFALEQAARERVDRGRFDITARVCGPTPLAPRLDLGRARATFAALQQLRDELAPGSELPVSVVASIPELFSWPAPEDQREVGGALAKALAAAFEDLERMQRYEGNKLRGELVACLDRLRELRAALSLRCADQVARARTRLQERLERLLGDQQLAGLLESAEPVGRRIDFLLQEVAREANTIASKGQDAATSQLIVEVKAEIERMRQQAANIA